MDTSETYVKMCDCFEVQDKKIEFKNGDWFAFYDPKYKGVRGDLIVAVVGATFYDFTRVYVKKWHHLSVVGWDEGDCELVWEDKIIGLPRQDQIQEMMLPLGYKIQATLLKKLYEFSEDTRGVDGVYNFKTMEQLWLAFYMQENRQKVWDGSKWTK